MNNKTKCRGKHAELCPSNTFVVEDIFGTEGEDHIGEDKTENTDWASGEVE